MSEPLEDLHHTAAHIAVQLVVRRDRRNVEALRVRAQLEPGLAEVEAESFRFLGCRDHHAVVIAQNDERPTLQRRVKDPLKGGVGGVDVDVCEHV